MKKNEKIILGLAFMSIMLILVPIYYFYELREPLIAYEEDFSLCIFQGILVITVVFFTGFIIGGFCLSDNKKDGIILKWLKENFNDIKFEINDKIKMSPIIVVLPTGEEVDGSEITVKNNWSGKTKLHKCLYLDPPTKLNKEKLVKLILEGRINVEFFDAEQ